MGFLIKNFFIIPIIFAGRWSFMEKGYSCLSYSGTSSIARQDKGL
ncbi:hypothetical protein HM1_0897 [Heliomicrobium modesticaldum Ice1]|uniref:Uncharacterized protein n=1 Tax=Heliobacterium modesticaldum (strain ATCC 51547 / Ice1) TaxID=498761 RepID=B0TAL6_HELMI|nr:hypothetical protein HM1_0897 [Heliomicrobium modesticaldum Ice1]